MSGVREALLALYEARGVLVPAAVVDAARDEASPLHSCFEWDDGVAAERHREDQARSLIRRVRVTFVSEAAQPPRVVQVRQFENVPGSGGYLSIEDVGRRPDLRDEVLAQARQDFLALRLRYQMLAEAFDLMVVAEVTAA